MAWNVLHSEGFNGIFREKLLPGVIRFGRGKKGRALGRKVLLTDQLKQYGMPGLRVGHDALQRNFVEQGLHWKFG